jgi:beta-galactosidase
MSRVTLEGRNLVLDGRPIFVRSGEVHYYRIPKASWGERLDLALRGGLNCICTYAPWFWHEPEEGSFDLSGETLPERDLETFLRLVEERGLYLIVRPGPFINSELRFGGHPEWVFRNHPEVSSLRADGAPAFWVGYGVPVPSQLHPVFLRLVNRWYAHVIPVLAKHSINRGGTLILTQPDNEMNLVFSYGLDGSLYDAHVIGDRRRPGLWQTWLLAQHGSLERMNARYDSNYQESGEVSPPREPIQGPAGQRRVLDWLRFKQWHIFEYARHLIGQMEGLGLDVPITLNEPINLVWAAGDHAACSKALREYRSRCFTTGHIYSTGGEQDALGLPVTLYRIEMMKAGTFDGPAFASELGAGWCDLTRNRAAYNWDILLRVGVGHGLNGFNIYMYSGGKSPPNSCRYGSDYDWKAPIGASGETNHAYPAVKCLGEFIAGWENEILATRKTYDGVLGVFSELPLLANHYERVKFTVTSGLEDIYGRSITAGAPLRDVYNSVLETFRVLTALNVNLEILNFEDPKLSPGPSCKVLFIPNCGTLSRDGLEFARQHLHNGGVLVMFPGVADTDTDGNRNDDLARLLAGTVRDVVPITGLQAGDIRFGLVDGREVAEAAVDKAVWLYDVSGKGQILARYQGQACAFAQDVLGGKVVVCGVSPIYLTEATQRLFWELFVEATGLERSCHSLDERLHVVLRPPGSESGGPTLVTTANCLGHPSATKIAVSLPNRQCQFPTATDFVLPPKSARLLWLDLDIGIARLLHCTSELQKEGVGQFLARGDPGTPGELAFDRPVEIRANGRRLEMTQREHQWIATYMHGAAPTRVSVRANRQEVSRGRRRSRSSSSRTD